MDKRIGWGIGLAVVLMMGLAITQLGASERLARELQQQHQTELLMFGASWCSVCARARDDFARRGIDYLELDVDADAVGNQQFRKLGGTSVPVFVVNGKVIRGYDRTQILAQLELSNQTVR